MPVAGLPAGNRQVFGYRTLSAGEELVCLVFSA
jgi:hypothetical protein